MQKPLRDLISSVGECSLSSREKNRAKRKARQAIGKQRSRDMSEEAAVATNGDEPDKKKIKLEDVKIKEETMILGKNLIVLCGCFN